MDRRDRCPGESALRTTTVLGNAARRRGVLASVLCAIRLSCRVLHRRFLRRLLVVGGLAVAAWAIGGMTQAHADQVPLAHQNLPKSATAGVTGKADGAVRAVTARAASLPPPLPKPVGSPTGRSGDLTRTPVHASASRAARTSAVRTSADQAAPRPAAAPKPAAASDTAAQVRRALQAHAPAAAEPSRPSTASATGPIGTSPVPGPAASARTPVPVAVGGPPLVAVTDPPATGVVVHLPLPAVATQTVRLLAPAIEPVASLVRAVGSVPLLAPVADYVRPVTSVADRVLDRAALTETLDRLTATLSTTLSGVVDPAALTVDLRLNGLTGDLTTVRLGMSLPVVAAHGTAAFDKGGTWRSRLSGMCCHTRAVTIDEPRTSSLPRSASAGALSALARVPSGSAPEPWLVRRVAAQPDIPALAGGGGEPDLLRIAEPAPAVLVLPGEAVPPPASGSGVGSGGQSFAGAGDVTRPDVRNPAWWSITLESMPRASRNTSDKPSFSPD